MSPSRPARGPEVRCQCCSGTGKVRLSAPLLRVLEAIQAGYDTAPDIYEQLQEKREIQPITVNRRLETLRKMGLLQRSEQRRGRQWVYGLATRSAEGQENR